MFRNRRGLLWMLAGGIVAALAGLIAMFALRTAVTTVQVPTPGALLTRPVVVATHMMARRAVLTEADVEIRELPEDAIRSGAVVKTEDAVGKITMTELNEGEIILAQNLLEITAEGVPGEAEVSLGEALEEDEVAVALPATDLMSRFGVVMPGDKVDLLFSVNVVGKTYTEEAPRGGLVAMTTVQDLEILQIVTEKPTVVEGEQAPEAGAQPSERLIILIADPQEAVIIKYLKDSGGIIDFALRAPTSERLFDTEPVTINYLARRYGIIPPEPLD
ncbi:MAG: Flp pilus assembly protein CpaB [Anaerolineae bacterium]|nr:Flp pilus assembly protein CpaB [Anaerolineae bacterium]